MKELYAEIAVPVPIDGTFTYRVPDELAAIACPGVRALVPFGSRRLTGFIISLSETPPQDLATDARISRIRPIIDILDPAPLFDEKRLKFHRWLAAYYFASIGESLSLICPAGISIKSALRLGLTEEGLLRLKEFSGMEREILLGAKEKAAAKTLLNRFKGKPVCAAIERLKKSGLVIEESILVGGGRDKTEDLVTVVNNPAADALALLKRKPVQAKVLSRISEAGTLRISELKEISPTAPGMVKSLANAGLVSITSRKVARDPMEDITPRASGFNPNGEQTAAINAIKAGLAKGSFAPFLLYGITGSGKTLVYLKAIEETIRAGKRALFLVPEISITPWPAAYLKELFPGRVAIAHSGLSEGERGDEWGRIASGEAAVIVGARSALFSPIADLGIIIVDEEHEQSYKDEQGIRYHARDAALMLGKTTGAAVVLGSATPSVESFYNAKNGRYELLRLENRVNKSELPACELHDMKGRKKALLSERLCEKIAECLNAGSQALLLLNRRGFSNFIICRDCGQTFMCPNCSVTMTMHKSRSILKCHYCDTTSSLPDECPKCKSINLAHPGIGTERLEEEVRSLFPAARIGRMDRDSTQKRGSIKKIIDAVEDKSIDILIGTQMISKGHHFPSVTLVGVIDADTSLNIPDFRSTERTFQLITQAAGRSGRGEDPGIVIIQTLNPGHYCLVSASRHDYEGFYAAELSFRKDADYPPFVRLCMIRIEGRKEDAVMHGARKLRATAERLIKETAISAEILGPTPALIATVKGRFRMQMLIKTPPAAVTRTLAFIKALCFAYNAKAQSGVAVIIDMDPATVA